jgi:hypothetical protein
MLQKVVFAWIILLVATATASAQKTARIHVNPDQSRTVTYQEKGYTYYPSRAINQYFGFTSRVVGPYGTRRVYSPRRVYSTYTGAYRRPYIRNWVIQLPAPKALPKRHFPHGDVPPDGVERSILVRPIGNHAPMIRVLGKVSDIPYEEWLENQRNNRKDVLVKILSGLNTG